MFISSLYSLFIVDQNIRDFIYGFFSFAKTNNVALDISFGTIGYSLILARAFQEVMG